MIVASRVCGKKPLPRAMYAVWPSGVKEIRYSSSSDESVPGANTVAAGVSVSDSAAPTDGAAVDADALALSAGRSVGAGPPLDPQAASTTRLTAASA